MTDLREKFQQKLRELFQFESADLDFGIYRIMNFRRAAIERFIEKELLDAVSKELASGTLADQAKVAEELGKLRKRIIEDIAEDAVDADGRLQEKHRDTRLGKQYLELQTRLGGARGKAEHEALVFNHLYTFFSRYYDAGDFLSLRRYSKKERYAIPYNGEEVHLHWANSDQYFIKTGENFTDYSFRSGNVTVRFKLRNAETEQDNRKAEKRFFLAQAKDAAYDSKTKNVTIPFEYRQLTEQEAISYGKKNQQDAIIAAALTALPRKFKDEHAALAALMVERRKNADGEPVSFLEHHLRSYTRRNTMDYFIHKNLKGFLERELDFYLKNEVLNLDEVTAGGETLGQGWFQIMRTIRAIGHMIIAFLAQIEDFQKRLFEKRKFITATRYCVTMSRIPEKFHEEIAGNEAQWREWKELLHIDDEAGDKDLFTPKTKKARRLKFLKDHPTLVLDTRHFDPSFTDDLLATFDNLDDATDGLLFHAENFQALNLMQEKFRERVKCIYIDPPYNTGNDDFCYKDQYQHSSWLAMMNARMVLVRPILTRGGVIFISVDDNEYVHLVHLTTAVLACKPEATIIRVNPSTKSWSQYLSTTHDYCLVGIKDGGSVPLVHGWSIKKPYIDEFKRRTAALLKMKLTDEEKRQGLRELVKIPMFKAFDHYTEFDKRGVYACGNPNRTLQSPGAQTFPDVILIHPDTKKRCLISPNWRFTQQKTDNLNDENRFHFGQDHTTVPRIKTYMDDYDTMTPQSVVFDDTQVDTKTILPGFGLDFDFPKPISFVKRLLEMASQKDSICMDYFSGSGTTFHALINLNREDGGKRTCILVEMAQHVENTIIPRLKKLIFTPEWKDGKPVRMATKQEAERSPRVIKYHRIESYEDALNNIRLDDAAGQAALRFDDYLLNYMLGWESKDCETFLNVEKLASPFSYKLVLTEGQETREQAVDLPETFAYLIALQIETRRIHLDKGRRYLVYRGACGARKTAVIWRDTAGWTEADRKRDAEFVAREKLTEGADDVFVNGDSHIPNARSLDPVFKQRMFAGVEA